MLEFLWNIAKESNATVQDVDLGMANPTLKMFTIFQRLHLEPWGLRQNIIC